MCLWELEDVPACEKGLALLQRFAEVHPDAFERDGGFVDLNHPNLETLPEWNDFASHCTSYDHCKER